MRKLISCSVIVVTLVAGRASVASIGTPYSVTTRTQGDDNTQQHTTSSYKPIGGSGSGTPGVCYMTKITGSFRGYGEYLNVGVDSDGYYTLYGESDTAYGGGSMVGPTGTMNCINTTQIGISPANLSTFSSAAHSPNATAGHIDEITNTSTAWVPVSGINGFMWWDNASAKTEVVSWSLLSETSANQSYTPASVCDSSPQCQLTTYQFSNVSSMAGEDFVYDSTYFDYECDLDNADGHGGPNCELASGWSSGTPTSICWIAGIKGYWNSQASAVIHGSGTHWYIELEGAQTDHVWAHATCMAIPQSL